MLELEGLTERMRLEAKVVDARALMRLEGSRADASARQADALLADARALGHPRLLQEALLCAGTVALHRLRPDAIALLEEGLGLSRTRGDEEAESMFLANLSTAYTHLAGDEDKAHQHLLRALAIGLRRDAPHLALVPYQALAVAASRKGALLEAQEYVSRALPATSKPRLRGFRSMMLWTLGRIQWRRGLPEAETTADRAVAEARFMGHAYPLLLAHQLRADVARTSGRFELARTHYAACAEVVDGSPRAMALLGFAQLEDATGNPEVAELHLDDAFTTLGDEADPGFHIYANLVAAQLALRRQRKARARRHLDQLEALGPRIHDVDGQALALALRAWMAHLDHRADDAARAWAEARALAPPSDVQLARSMAEVERILASSD